jgi:hypothetical protein
MTLGSTQPFREMSTSNISWVVMVPGAYCLQPYHLYLPIVLKFGNLSFLEPSGTVQIIIGITVLLFVFALLSSNSEKEPTGLRYFCFYYGSLDFLVAQDHTDYCGLVLGPYLEQQQ